MLEPREIAKDATNYEKYWQSYVDTFQLSFIVAIGDFEKIGLDNFDENDWAIFMLCALFNVVLLLNLLIAIIGQTFNQISSSQDEQSYKEKAFIVSQMQNTFKWFVYINPKHNERIFIAKVVDSDQIRSEDYGDQMNDMKSEIQGLHKSLNR